MVAKLSIIIPVFNEKGTVEEILKRVTAAPVLDYEKEIIVVDDGSDDGTEKILENLKKNLILFSCDIREILARERLLKPLSSKQPAALS